MGLYVRGRKMWWMTYAVHGVQHYESCHTHNRREAERILRARLGEIAQGRYHPPVATRSPLLSSWSKEFLATVRDENTRRRYLSSTRNLISFFPKARIAEISPRDIEMFKRSRLASGAGPATCNRDLAVLRRMLKLALQQRFIAETPFTNVEFLEERKYRRQPHVLTWAEQERLIAVAAPRIRALVVLLTETGLRVNKEALQLRWEDVDFLNDVIHVRQSKTSAGIRSVPLSNFCKVELLRWRELLGPAYSPFVFASVSGTRHPLQGGRKSWVSALKRAQISPFPIAHLRHTFATRLAATGVSALTVSEMLGHAGTGIVRTYARLLDGAAKEAISKLETLRESRLHLTTETEAGVSPRERAN